MRISELTAAFLGLTILFAPVFEANAGSVGPATITNVLVTEGLNTKGQDGTFMIYISPSVSNGPTCATQHNRFVVNAGTDGGRAQIALLLAAQAEGKTLNIQGSGACDVYPDTETIYYIQTN